MFTIVESVDADTALAAPPETTLIRLRVFERNRRARRFYERLGWGHTGKHTTSAFPPHPVLVEYRRPLSPVVQ